MARLQEWIDYIVEDKIKQVSVKLLFNWPVENKALIKPIS